MSTSSSAAPTRPIKVGMVSLGCAKNLVDSEVMMGLLAHAGCELTQDPQSADVLVVNTCTFIGPAKESPSTPFWRWPATKRKEIARR